MCMYYAENHLKDLPEFWVRTSQEVCPPIHELAGALGISQCLTLPFIHSLSGRDTTSYPYFIGRKAWLASNKKMETTDLEKLLWRDLMKLQRK